MTTRWVELRVHGVSGTPPEAMLAAPHVLQVDGDDRSRFFRRVDAAGNLIDGGYGRVLEGFHWGRYTSGSLKQSLYIALLPFGLVNMVAYMLPSAHRANGDPIRGARAMRTVCLGLLRLVGLVLTLTFAFTLTLVLVQVLATAWLSGVGVPPAWAARAPGIALAASGTAMGLLGGLAWVRDLHPKARRRDEDPLAPTPAGADPPGPRAPEAVQKLTPFADRQFYRGDPDSPTLRLLHVAGGVLVPTLIVTNAGRPWTGLSLGVVAAALLAGVIFVVVFLGDPETVIAPGGVPTSRNGLWHDMAHWLARGFVVAAAIVLVVARGSEIDTSAERFEVWAQYAVRAGVPIVFITMLCFGILAARVRSTVPRRRTSAWYFRPFSGNLAPVALLSIAASLAVGISAAVVVGVTATLEKLGRSSTKLEPIETVERIAQAWGGAVLVLPAVAVFGWLWWALTRGKRQDHVESVLPPSPAIPEIRLVAWQRKLRNAIWFARLKNHIQGIVWSLCVLGTGLGVFHLAYVLGEVPGLSSRLERNLVPVLAPLGTWTLLGLIVGLVSLMRGAFRDANLRRYVNIGWDIIAFWPHAVHPFIPAPYSVRAVGDLAERIRGHLRADSTGPVVLAAHSQGSLLSFAALSSLSNDELRRVRFLTCGSQLRLIFARAFPMYVNYEAIKTLHDRLDRRWINLYRDTDPIAGPVLSWNRTPEGCEPLESDHFPTPDAPEPTPGTRELDRVSDDGYRTRQCGGDWRLMDPVPRVNAEQEAPIEKVHGHSNYWTDPVWPAAVAELE